MVPRTFTKISFFLISLLILASINGNAQDSSRVIPLWKNGAPGFEKLKNEPEQAKDWWVRNINDPSVTVFLPPKENATGTAVVVCPGGGFTNLVFNAEGRDAAKFLNNIGVAAFVLKYRLFRMENSPYKQENAEQDIFRAMRLIKSRAKEFNIDTTRLGVMGFSAGGELAGWVSYKFAENHAASDDAIDKFSARPSFEILIYPGPLSVPDVLPSNAPPAFMLASNGDDCCSEPIIKLTEMHRKAKVPIEMHLYEKGAHAFNMGYRSEFVTLQHWPERLKDWMQDTGLLKKE